MVIFLITPWIVFVTTAYIFRYMQADTTKLLIKHEWLQKVVDSGWFNDGMRNGYLLLLTNVLLITWTAGLSYGIYIIGAFILYWPALLLMIIFYFTVWYYWRSLWQASEGERWASSIIGNSVFFIIAGLLYYVIYQLDVTTVRATPELSNIMFVSYLVIYSLINLGSVGLLMIGLTKKNDSRG